MTRKQVELLAIGFVSGALLCAVGLSGQRFIARGANAHQASANAPASARSEGAIDTRADGTGNELHEYAEANRSLALQVRDSQRRLEQLDAERAKLQADLQTMERTLHAAQGDAGGAEKSPFDLDAKDWAELAKEGTVKYRTPCITGTPWTPPPDKLQQLGLAPTDGITLHDAYVASNKRLWSEIGPLCAEIVGNSEVPNKIGLNTCIHLIVDLSRDRDRSGADEAMRQVGEILAGARPMPLGNEVSPLVKMFLALANENRRFETDLVKVFGPHEAHRLAFSKAMCATQAEFGGAGPREPQSPIQP
jgi:hypothetical protein